MLNELKVSVAQRLLKLDKGNWLVTGDKLKKGLCFISYWVWVRANIRARIVSRRMVSVYGNK